MPISALSSDQTVISRLAPAKINLALHVTGQRDNGYHELEMLVVFAHFGDRISVCNAPQDDFTVDGYYGSDIPLDGQNLVLKARDLLRRQSPERASPVHIHLEKKLPIAAGIGGGSTDAAATLIALNDLWQLDLHQQQLMELGLQLGADVPMCLHSQSNGSPLLVHGIGEDLKVLTDFPPLHLLLVNDGTAISTPAIFKSLKKRDNPPLPAIPPLPTTADVCGFLSTTRNDLFAPAQAQAPLLQSHLDSLTKAGADFVQMSGSGASCFAVFSSAQKLNDACAAMRAKHSKWFVVATQTYGSL